ncbi:MAG: hypothetical protein HY720_05475 [Planctomycetes bacterium]|nr:hypothetical protein [Planctomycetota bacterium]
MIARFLVLLLFFAPAAWARYARPDLEEVPFERLVANLEKKLAADPANAGLVLALARVHAMAWAVKADTVEARRGGDEPWYGYEPDAVPFEPVPADDPERLKAAKEHLAKAIEGYARGVELAPDDLAARLGLAWCRDQAGEKEAAIQGYRDVFAAAWEKEKDRKSLDLRERPVAQEAAEYLIPLLDPAKDAEEIARLQEASRKLESLPRPITPILVPLQDGLALDDLVDPAARVSFDLDGSGLAREWGWITPSAAWLVHDPRGQGDIRSGLQLIGSVTFWIFWTDGYQALAALDDDGDGELRGSELAGLALWHDADSSGTSDPGEVRSLGEHGIVALSCRGARHPSGILSNLSGVTLDDGHSRETYDWIPMGTAMREAAHPGR